jgi:hypothetical protein
MKLPDNEENEGRTEGEVGKRQQRREKEGKGVEEEDGARERENERQEADTGELEAIQDEVRDHAPSITASTPVKPVPRKHARLDWATNDDESIGPVPNASEFRPSTPAQPVCAPPRPAVTPSNDDAAPCAHTPAMGATSDHVPAASVPTKCTPGTYTPTPPIIHSPRDLSGLRSGLQNPWGSLTRCRQHSYLLHDHSSLSSDAPNPWGSLRRRHYSRSSHAPRRFTHQRQYPPTYPVNSYLWAHGRIGYSNKISTFKFRKKNHKIE